MYAYSCRYVGYYSFHTDIHYLMHTLVKNILRIRFCRATVTITDDFSINVYLFLRQIRYLVTNYRLTHRHHRTVGEHLHIFESRLILIKFFSRSLVGLVERGSKALTNLKDGWIKNCVASTPVFRNIKKHNYLYYSTLFVHRQQQFIRRRISACVAIRNFFGII